MYEIVVKTGYIGGLTFCSVAFRRAAAYSSAPGTGNSHESALRWFTTARNLRFRCATSVADDAALLVVSGVWRPSPSAELPFSKCLSLNLKLCLCKKIHSRNPSTYNISWRPMWSQASTLAGYHFLSRFYGETKSESNKHGLHHPRLPP